MGKSKSGEYSDWDEFDNYVKKKDQNGTGLKSGTTQTSRSSSNSGSTSANQSASDWDSFGADVTPVKPVSNTPNPTVKQPNSLTGNAPIPDNNGNDYSFNPSPVLNPTPRAKVNISGVSVPLDIPSPFDDNKSTIAVKELQERIDSKTYSLEDVKVIAKSMKYSPLAASAFMDGKTATSSVIHYNDVKAASKNQLQTEVQNVNKQFGLNDNFDEAFSTAESAGAYLSKVEKLYDNKADEEARSQVSRIGNDFNIPSVSNALGGTQLIQTGKALKEVSKENDTSFQKIKSIIANDIVDKINEDETLTKDQKVKKIYKLADARDKKNVDDAIEKRLSPVRYLSEIAFNTTGGNSTSKEIDLLNSTKANIEKSVNDNTKDKINYYTSLLESEKENFYDGAEHSSEDQDAFAKRTADLSLKLAGLKKEYVTKKELYAKYPTLMNTELAQSVNDYNAKGSRTVDNNLKEYYDNITLDEHLRNEGFDPNDQKVKDFLAGDNFKDYTFFGRPLHNAFDVFSNSAKAIGDITGIRDNADILSEKKQAELFPNQVGENDQYKLGTWSTIGQNVGNTTGQVVGQGLLQAGTLGLGRIAGLSKVAAANGAFWSSGALTSYDQAYKDATEFIDNEAGRVSYAGLIALSNAASERIFPDIKVFQIPGVSEAFSELSKKVGTAGFTNELAEGLLAKAKNAIVDYGKKFGENVAKETVEEVATQNFEDGLRFISGDPNANFDKAVENAKNTAIQTATGMLAIGAYGAHKDIKAERNISNKSILYQAATYHDQALDALQTGFNEGHYGQDELNEKIKTVNTAQVALQALKVTEDVSGKTLKRPEASLYVANLTAESLLKDQRSKTEDVLAHNQIDEKIKNLQNQRQQVLSGEVVIDDYGNIKVPEKKQSNSSTNTQSNETVITDEQGGKQGSESSQASQTINAETNNAQAANEGQDGVLNQTGAVDQNAAPVIKRPTLKTKTNENTNTSANPVQNQQEANVANKDATTAGNGGNITTDNQQVNNESDTQANQAQDNKTEKQRIRVKVGTPPVNEENALKQRIDEKVQKTIRVIIFQYLKYSNNPYKHLHHYQIN